MDIGLDNRRVSHCPPEYPTLLDGNTSFCVDVLRAITSSFSLDLPDLAPRPRTGRTRNALLFSFTPKPTASEQIFHKNLLAKTLEK